MRIAAKIWDSGWGAIFLAAYVLVIIHLFAPEEYYLKSMALLPTLVVMFLADRYSFYIIHFFAGDELQRSTEEIEQTTGENHFYESASEEVQARVDDLDRRAYQNSISILAGFLIGITAPFVGFYFEGLVGGLGGLVVAVFVGQLLARRSVQQLNSLARDIKEPYAAKYENR